MRYLKMMAYDIREMSYARKCQKSIIIIQQLIAKVTERHRKL